MGKKKKSGPLYNYKSPRDYEVFNMGNEADPPFKLKSGNTPLFKHVGSSPNNQGTRFSTKTDTSTTTGTDNKKENRDIIVKAGEKKTGGQMVGEAIAAGLDSVYHTGKVKYDNTIEIAKDKEEVDKKTNTISENIIAGTDDGKTKTGQMPNEDWKAGEAKAKEAGHDMDTLLENQKTMDKDSQEWKDNQNKINKALGDETQH